MVWILIYTLINRKFSGNELSQGRRHHTNWVNKKTWYYHQAINYREIKARSI
jgi:hypothetical protein